MLPGYVREDGVWRWGLSMEGDTGVRPIDANRLEQFALDKVPPDGYDDDFLGGVLWMLDRADEIPTLTHTDIRMRCLEVYNRLCEIDKHASNVMRETMSAMVDIAVLMADIQKCESQ